MRSTFRANAAQTTVAWFTVFSRGLLRSSAASACARLRRWDTGPKDPRGMSMSGAVRLVVVMDPIEAIHPEKDSTLAILLAAQSKGWQLYYAELKDLWLRDGIARGRLAPLQVFDDSRTWFTR